MGMQLPRGPMRFKKTGVKGKGLAAAFHEQLLKHTSERGNMRKRQVKRFTTNKGSRIVGHDMIGTVELLSTSQEADDIIRMEINPVALGFPALSKQAELNQQFKFHSFSVRMPDTATSFVNGDALGWFDRDPNEELPEGIVGLQVGYYKGGKVGSFKKGHQWHLPRFDQLPVLYCNDNGSDERFVTQAIFNLQVITPPSVYTGTTEPTDNQVNLVLELWATYDCEFFVPDITESFADAPDQLLLQAQGNAGTLNFLATDPLVFSTSTVEEDILGIPANIPGFYWILDQGSDRCGILAGYGMDAVSQIAYQVAINSVEDLTMAAQQLLVGGTNITPLAITGGYGKTNSNKSLVAAGTFHINVPGVASDYTPESGSAMHILEEDGTVTTTVCDGTQTYRSNWQAQFNVGGAGDLSGSTRFTSLWTIAGYGNSSQTLISRIAGPQTLEGYARCKYEELDVKTRMSYGSLGAFYKFLHEKLHPRRDPQLPDIEDIISKHRRPSGKEESKEQEEDTSMELGLLRTASSPPPTPNSGVKLELVERKALPTPKDSGANKPLEKKKTSTK